MAKISILEERVIKLRAWLIARVKLAKVLGDSGETRYRVLVTYAFPEDKIFGKGRSWNSLSDWNPDPEQLRHLADVIDLFQEKADKLELFGEEGEGDEKKNKKEEQEVNHEEYDLSGGH